MEFFFFKQKTAYEMLRSLVGSEMCIRDRIIATSGNGGDGCISFDRSANKRVGKPNGGNGGKGGDVYVEAFDSTRGLNLGSPHFHAKSGTGGLGGGGSGEAGEDGGIPGPGGAGVRQTVRIPH
eukprot:TRINITY_DN25289_c0_g1_i1.p1 TRINITY_DN25289_c0_g1~~TRINITY_DN25289_c0_g1_i1.p1  ORF type:complete len:123 (-),score=27.81 TRINITY_DN25289_c0_g1_i1:75-443(-)